MPLCRTPASIYQVSTPVPPFGVTGKIIAFVGDSTSPSVAVTAGTLLTNYTAGGAALDGCTIYQWGENGASLAAYMTDGVTHGFSALKALSPAPDFVRFSYGINSVRLGSFTQQQFTDALSSAIDQHVAALPSAAFLLSIPAPFLTTDVNASGYVSPNSSAQAYSTILQNAYAAQAGRYKNVFIHDMPKRIFGRVCPALSDAMTDQLHPNAVGQAQWVKDLVENFISSNVLALARA